MNNFLIIGSFLLFGCSSICYFGYQKIFADKKYKILKDYEYKDSRVQLIINPQNNVCPHCFDILEENDEIARFPDCDHHYCEKCIHKQIDDSQSDLKNIKIKPCAMCMKV